MTLGLIVARRAAKARAGNSGVPGNAQVLNMPFEEICAHPPLGSRSRDQGKDFDTDVGKPSAVALLDREQALLVVRKGLGKSFPRHVHIVVGR